MSLKITSKIKGYSVLKPQDAPKAPENFVTDEADRRLKLDTVQTPVASSLRWESRPQITEGTPAQVFSVIGPEHKFFVIVSYVRNGSPTTGYPFEVLVAGNVPRSLNALAKSLSMDMRSRDRAWLKAKLESIGKTEGTAFDMTMPDGNVYAMPSEVAAFARLVQYQCEQLGAFSDENLAVTPLMDALMSTRRPKTTPEGTVAWCADVTNAATGDRFKLFLPELEMPDGRKRPYEVWFDGIYPLQSFRGLAKCLSLDFQVNDLDWVVRKLRQLETIEENQGDFWAPIPGSDKSKVYPSSVAYVASLILHRLRRLGLVDDHGAKGVSNVLTIVRPTEAAQQSDTDVPKAIQCPECKSYSVVMSSGCPQCTACQWSRCS